MKGPVVPELLNEHAAHAAPPVPVQGAWSFDLPYLSIPAGLSLNSRSNWRVKHASTQMVRTDVFVLTRKARVPALERIRVDVKWTVNTKHRRDSDNLAPLLKAIYDGIGADRGISARIVEDDAPQFMLKPAATILFVRGSTPHFTVTITDIGAGL